MTKSQLAEKVAEKTGLKKKQATAAIEAVLEIVKHTLAKGEKVQLIPFGRFEVRHRKAREGRNPRTGAQIHIKSRKVPAFHAGKALKEAVSRSH
jgi:DNA-binding protein HU-beta